MSAAFPPCLYPENLPGEWRLGMPIDLLPAFRLRYPGWINESLLSVELAVEGSTGRWELRIRRVDEQQDRVRQDCVAVAALGGEHDDKGAATDDRIDRFPDGALRKLFDIERIEALSNAVGLFSPAAAALAIDISRAFQAREVMDDLAIQTRRADFCERTARDLAGLVASELLDRCTRDTIRRIRGSNVELAGDWLDAAGIIQDDDSLLREIAIRDIDIRASASLESLSNAERRALWLAYEDSADADSLLGMAQDWEARKLSSFDPMTSWTEGMPECESIICGRVVAELESVVLDPDDCR